MINKCVQYCDVNPWKRDSAVIQPELTCGISRSDISTVSQQQIETVQMSSCGSQVKAGKQGTDVKLNTFKFKHLNTFKKDRQE